LQNNAYRPLVKAKSGNSFVASPLVQIATYQRLGRCFRSNGCIYGFALPLIAMVQLFILCSRADRRLMQLIEA
jgi:hypothetical protein